MLTLPTPGAGIPPCTAEPGNGTVGHHEGAPPGCLAYLPYVNRTIELTYCDLHCSSVPKGLISAACQSICRLAAGCHQFAKEG